MPLTVTLPRPQSIPPSTKTATAAPTNPAPTSMPTNAGPLHSRDVFVAADQPRVAAETPIIRGGSGN